MVSTLEGVLEEGDVFVDVGANEGFFSVLASRLVGTTGRVVSIEPQSRLQNVLQMNLLANGASNVLVLQRLISDEDGIARLWLSPDMNPGSSGLFLNTRYPTRYEMVPQVTLVHLIESLRLDKIKLLKIDIEGYEYEAILGSRSLFEQTVIDYVALELHPTLLKRRGKSQDEVLRFLAESGYKTIDGYSNLVLRKLGA
jgi:FkbM family methyltransferase